MELDKEKVEKFAWNLFDLDNKLKGIGYYITKEAKRDGGQYTIFEIAARGDSKSLISNTDEMINRNHPQIENALSEINRIKETILSLQHDLDWFENQLRKSAI